MKVLVVHNRYQQRGGEDTVVDAEIALLRAQGHSVELFERRNDDIHDMSRGALALQTVWSRPSSRTFRDVLRLFSPDVVHTHNTFPLISPAVLWDAHRARIPVVQTLHNYRLLCPQGLMLRNNQICEDCVGRLPWRAVTNGCYRGSQMQSAVAACSTTVHNLIGTWQRKVTRYIALNEFCRQKFIQGGLPDDRIVVKPNFVAADTPAQLDRSDFLFVGRLAPEKGVQVLATAAAALNKGAIRVAGDGPESQRLDSVPGIVRLGTLPRDAVFEAMRRSIAVVVPSIWNEAFGMTVVEAFANGAPVIASRIAGLPDLVTHGETGLLFEPGNAADLLTQLQWAQSNPDEMAAMGRRARQIYESSFTAEANYRQLIAIYEDAIREVRQSMH